MMTPREMVKLYIEEGCSIREIARQSNYSYGAVHYHLKKQKVALRKPGYHKPTAA